MYVSLFVNFPIHSCLQFVGETWHCRTKLSPHETRKAFCDAVKAADENPSEKGSSTFFVPSVEENAEECCSPTLDGDDSDVTSNSGEKENTQPRVSEIVETLDCANKVLEEIYSDESEESVDSDNVSTCDELESKLQEENLQVGPISSSVAKTSLCTESTKSPTVQNEELTEATHSNDPNKCEFCCKAFRSKVALRKHLRKHDIGKMFKCSECVRTFREKSQLAKHMRTHTGEKPYSCEFCGRKFATNSSRQIHVRTHTGEKPYKCQQCSKAFCGKGDLTTHMRTHSEEKQFKCSTCFKSYRRSQHLRIHIRTHTGEKPYKCLYCPRTFKYDHHCQYHIRTHTGERPHKCAASGVPRVSRARRQTQFWRPHPAR